MTNPTVPFAQVKFWGRESSTPPFCSPQLAMNWLTGGLKLAYWALFWGGGCNFQREQPHPQVHSLLNCQCRNHGRSSSSRSPYGSFGAAHTSRGHIMPCIAACNHSRWICILRAPSPIYGEKPCTLNSPRKEQHGKCVVAGSSQVFPFSQSSLFDTEHLKHMFCFLEARSRGSVGLGG